MRAILAVMKVELLRHLTTPAFYLLLFFLSLISGYFLLVLIRGFIELTLQFGANPEAVNLHFHERILPHLSSRLEFYR